MAKPGAAREEIDPEVVILAVMAARGDLISGSEGALASEAQALLFRVIGNISDVLWFR
jgi:hypothetical protein